MSHNVIYGSVMLIAGMGIPVMAALNSGLGHKLQSPIMAASILFMVGLVTAITVLMFAEGIPSWQKLASAPWYMYAGGLFVIFYILSITWVAPHFGVSNAVSFVLLGQLIAMTIVDHFGFVGAQQYSISIERVIGLILMIAGIIIVVRSPVSST